MRKLAVCLGLLVISGIVSAQNRTVSSRETLDTLSDNIMKKFALGKYSEAVQLLKRSSSLDTVFVNNLDKTVNEQMTNIQESYGKTVGAELVEQKSLKDVLVRRRYLLKFELYFLTFDFYLYNNGTGWTISGFYYKDDQKGLF